MPGDALDEGWDEIGHELALEDAKAFAAAFAQDQGDAAVQAQAVILPDDAFAAWEVTREALIENWQEMVFHCLEVIGHLEDRTTYEPAAAESLLLMGHRLQVGIAALAAFGSRFSEADVDAAVEGGPPPAGSLH